MTQTVLVMHSCDKCAILNKAVLSKGTGISLSTLQKAKKWKHSCPTLATVYRGVMLYKQKWGYWSKKDLQVDIRITKDGVLEADIQKMSIPTRIAMIEFYVLPGSFPPWPTPEEPSAGDDVRGQSKNLPVLVPYIRGTSTRISLEPESEEFSGMISTWIKDCQNHHSACKSSTSPATLPTRVIDVGPPDGGAEPHLCDTDGERGEYIALSHCWGGRQPLITTKENKDFMKACIPWAKLPNTFQDAILVTRRLGLRYIWIDSLCIVQDDAEDWKREAAKMALIFEAAYLTIAATAATDGSQGLFPRERGHEFIMGGSKGEQHIYMREKRSDDCFLPRRMNTGHLAMDMEVDYKVEGLYPLQKRAWCFQELILSTRVLHFTHSEIVWHCRTKWDCECGAVSLGGSNIRKFNSSMRNPAVYHENDEFAQSVQWPEINKFDPSRSWYDIVSVFTSNQITYREDILPALSGTAKKFGRLRGGRYVAGLWEDSFAHDLSWHVPMTDWSSRPTTYLGPSFSWCSCVSRIEWPNWTYDYLPRMKILYLSFAVDGMDPTGKVSIAFVKVRGFMTPAHLILQTRPHITSMEDVLRDQATGGKAANTIDLKPGGPKTVTQCAIMRPQEAPLIDGEILRATTCRLDTVDDVHYASFCRTKGSNGRACDCCQDGPWKPFNGMHPEDLCTDKNLVYCLRILESNGGDNKVFVALILVPSNKMGPGIFKRIGIVHDMGEEFFRDEQDQEVTIV